MRNPRHATLLAALALGACGPTIRPLDVAGSGGVILSADTRAVIAQNGKVCAEPQPDAMRAVATELAAALKAEGPASLFAPGAGGTVSAGGSASAATREAIASLGQRTPTVQVLRDALYRACEAHMNGLLEPGHVRFIAGRLDNVMIGLHAIDGLTGMHGGPAIAIGTVGTASATPGGQSSAGGSAPLVSFQGAPTNAMSAQTAKEIAAGVVEVVRLTVLEHDSAVAASPAARVAARR